MHINDLKQQIQSGNYKTYWSILVNNIKSGNVKHFSSLFYTVESEYALISLEDNQDFYNNLISDFKNHLLYPHLQKGNFNIECMKVGAILLKYSFISSYTDQDKFILDEVEKQFPTIPDTNRKFIYINLILLLNILVNNHGNGRRAFLGNLIDLNINKIFATGKEISIYFPIFRAIYYNLDELIDDYICEVFTDDFWNKNLIAQKSNFLWITQIFWQMYGYERNFLKLYDYVLEFFHKSMERHNNELTFFLHFILSHTYLNLIHTQSEMKKFNEDVERPLSDYIKYTLSVENNIAPVVRELDRNKKPLRVAFVYDRIVFSSPVKLLISLLKRLQEENDGSYEYFVYDLEYINKSFSDPKAVKMITDIGVNYVSNHKLLTKDGSEGHYYSHFRKSIVLRDKIIKDGIDILIMTNSREQLNFLFSTRTAPKQIFWCHGNFEYDVHGIDKRITHISKGLMQENDIHFDRFRIRQDDVFLKADIEECKKKAAEIRKKFPKDAVILGAIGRLIKLEGEGYLETVAKIMKHNPDTVYVACGTGGTENIKKKVKDLGIDDRFYFEGWVDPKVYAHVIDVYLNTFPDPSGEALNEYFYQNISYGVVRQNDINQYISEALNLIEYSRSIGRENLRSRYKFGGEAGAPYKLVLDLNNKSLQQVKEKAYSKRKDFPEDTVILGAILDSSAPGDDYLQAVATVLREYTDTVYMCFVQPAAGQDDIDDLYLKAKEYGIDDKFYVIRQDDPHLAYFMIDIYLNPFYENIKYLAEWRSLSNAKPPRDFGVMLNKQVNYNVEKPVFGIKSDKIPYELIDEYILTALVKVNIFRHRNLLYDLDSEEFWEKEKQKYEEIRKSKHYPFNEDAKKKFLHENGYDNNTIVLAMYLPPKYSYMTDEIVYPIKSFLDDTSCCKLMLFTDSETDNLSHNDLIIKDVNEIPIFKSIIDFVVYMPIVSIYQPMFFGIHPVLWLNKKEMVSSETMKDFINTFHNTPERIKLQEIISFDSIHNYLRNDNFPDIFEMIIRSYQNFGVDNSTSEHLRSLAEYSMYDYKVYLTKFLCKSNNFLNAHKARSYTSVYLDLLNQRSNNINSFIQNNNLEAIFN